MKVKFREVRVIFLIIFTWIGLSHGEISDEELYPIIISTDGDKAVLIVPDKGCHVVEDTGAIERLVVDSWKRHESSSNIIRTDDRTVEGFIDLCEQYQSEEINATQFVIGLHEKSWLIFPGTHFCGAGNDAADYDDLGHYVETDKCCRDHDFCTNIIDGRSCHPEIPELCNPTPWTRSHCSCDNKFRACLQKANETASWYIGLLFFNVFGLKCFREDHPILKCEEWGGFLNLHCQRYVVDTTKTKLYQFFDSPKFFRGKIIPAMHENVTSSTTPLPTSSDNENDNEVEDTTTEEQRNNAVLQFQWKGKNKKLLQIS